MSLSKRYVEAVVVWTLIALSAGKPHTDDLESLFVPCHSRTCDLRTQYCDDVIKTCARCSDDCDPSRISGNEFATSECQRVCTVYYKMMTTVTPTSVNLSVRSPLSALSVATQNMSTTYEFEQLRLVLWIIAICLMILAATAIVFVTMRAAMCCIHRHHRYSSTRRRGHVVCDNSAHCRPGDNSDCAFPFFISSDHLPRPKDVELTLIRNETSNNFEKTSRLHLSGHQTGQLSRSDSAELVESLRNNAVRQECYETRTDSKLPLLAQT